MNQNQNRPFARAAASRGNPVPQKVRVTIHDVDKDPSPKLFVVNRGPSMFKQPSVVSFIYRGEDGEPKVSYSPVTITQWQPEERKY